ncbi:uncharacterized protein BJ171DRAFT_512814 [Polychytrium aggregatum]|uniref:uncharacterized protein n=1 Tax=Polychytrium aggregatum TaxID=110093 RepID=UPI0022FDEEC8|nr:uncharacterized protein BJ171DRAFT_512814 [Polychytrium aggregatum]KAI9202650.1 hypothetical protein BJ171DRAFT_512814 [Polychytrium aggregatum]
MATYHPSDHFDLDSILVEQQKIPAVFGQVVPEYGFLDGLHDTSDLPAETRVELPFWMASELAQRDIVQLDLPKCFGPKIMSDLTASAKAVPLNNICSYYFAFATKLLDLIEIRDLSSVLLEAFRSRIREVMDFTQTPQRPDRLDYLNALDETEKQLYRAGRDSVHLFEKWQGSMTGRIRMASVLERQAKRIRRS